MSRINLIKSELFVNVYNLSKLQPPISSIALNLRKVISIQKVNIHIISEYIR